MSDINETTVMTPSLRNAKRTLHLNKSALDASSRIRSGISPLRPVVRVFPRKDFENPKSASYVSHDATNRSAQ